MNITVGARGYLEIEGARLIYRNFRGEGSKFNREGDRNFAVVIENEEMANELKNMGWNVKIRPGRDEEDDLFMFLQVKVHCNEYGPSVYLLSGPNTNKLCEDEIDCLDSIDIANVDMIVRPYDWDLNGKTGRTAYLQSIYVTQNFDRFASKYLG